VGGGGGSEGDDVTADRQLRSGIAIVPFSCMQLCLVTPMQDLEFSRTQLGIFSLQ